jgi:hypothetical protein
MLLVWYTPPRAGAQRHHANWLMRWREYDNIRDDEEVLLLLWWAYNVKENNNG